MTEQAWNPESLLRMSGGYWQTCALHAGVKLEVFTRLGERTCSAEEMAGEIQGDGRGVTMLLNALVAMNLLEKTEGRYANTPVSGQFLSKASGQYIGHMIMHQHHVMHGWIFLDKAVVSGAPVRPEGAFSMEAFVESFLMGMNTLATALAPMIVKEADLSGRRHLLDLGGGPGTYSIHFCKGNPDLKATVYDLPTSRPFAEKTIQGFGLEDRIGFLDGDFLKDPVPGRYDAAWLSHILHGEGPEACEGILGKAVAALEPGGMILVHEFILDEDMASPLFPALFSLNMLVGTPKGQSYSERQLRDMLAGQGVKDIKRLPFLGPNESAILTGTV